MEVQARAVCVASDCVVISSLRLLVHPPNHFHEGRYQTLVLVQSQARFGHTGSYIHDDCEGLVTSACLVLTLGVYNPYWVSHQILLVCLCFCRKRSAPLTQFSTTRRSNIVYTASYAREMSPLRRTFMSLGSLAKCLVVEDTYSLNL